MLRQARERVWSYRAVGIVLAGLGFLLASVLLVTLRPSYVAADDPTRLVDADTIVLGRVSGNPRKHFAAFDALGEYLVEELSALGVKQHDVVLARDNDEMVDLLRSGSVDIVSETPFSALLYEKLTDAEIVLRQWKSGVPRYRTLLITSKNSDIQGIDDLAGRLIAFEDPGSTSGYFVPKATIGKFGLHLAPVDEFADPASVRYLFAGSEINVLAWVARGRVDAGAISNIDWMDPARTPPSLQKELRVFYSSPNIIRSVILVRSTMRLDLKQKLIEVLVKMNTDESGRKTLEMFYETTQFDTIEGEALESLENVRNLFRELGLLGS